MRCPTCGERVRVDPPVTKPSITDQACHLCDQPFRIWWGVVGIVKTEATQ